MWKKVHASIAFTEEYSDFVVVKSVTLFGLDPPLFLFSIFTNGSVCAHDLTFDFMFVLYNCVFTCLMPMKISQKCMPFICRNNNVRIFVSLKFDYRWSLLNDETKTWCSHLIPRYESILEMISLWLYLSVYLFLCLASIYNVSFPPKLYNENPPVLQRSVSFICRVL